MVKTGWKSTAVLAITLISGVGGKASQTSPGINTAGALTISDNVDLVLLNVAVKRPQGGFVTGLGQDNFQVYEDGQRRPIKQFGQVDEPVTVGLVVDNSGSMRPKRPEVVLAGLAFARQSNPKDQFFVVNFNNAVVRGLPDQMLFTDDLQSLRSALYFGKPEGQTALYDAIAYSLAHLEFSHQEKRTLIVVSDGGDNVSETKFAQVLQLVEASRATIFAIGLYDPEDHDAAPSVLRKLTTVTGGEFFEPAKLEDIIPLVAKISQQVRNSYTIGFAPDETSDKRVLRSVKVSAQEDGKKLNVRARTTYWIKPSSDLVAAQRLH